MTVNTFYDFQFNPSTGGIDHIYYCTNDGKKELLLQHLFSKFSFLDNAPFTFSNLCKHYPNRILIYAEPYSPYCENEWWNYANYSLMSAYSRITKIFEDNFGYSSNEPIRFETPLFIDTIYRYILPNGLEILSFPAMVYSQIHQGEGSALSDIPDYLLLYPITFKKVRMEYMGSDYAYLAYNPQLGITNLDLYQTFKGNDFLYKNIDGGSSHLFTQSFAYSNPICDNSGSKLRFPVFPVNRLNTFRNIDLAKLNIGANLSSIQGVYNA